MTNLDSVKAYRTWSEALRGRSIIDVGDCDVLANLADAAIAACLDEIKRLNEICDRLAEAGRRG